MERKQLVADILRDLATSEADDLHDSVKKWKFNIVNHPGRTFRNALIANNMSLVRGTTLKKSPEHFAVLGFSLSGIRNQSWNTCRQLCCTLGVQIKWGNV